MGLFDVFTGDAYSDAAQAQRSYLGMVPGQVAGVTNKYAPMGIGALESGAYGALPAIGTATTAAKGYVAGATDPALASLYGYAGQGAEALTGGAANATAALQAGLDPAVAAISGGADKATAALLASRDPALAALSGGVERAAGAYDPLAAAAGRYGSAAGGASSMEADALGLNGPEGVARAQAAFTKTPGYEFQLGEGLNAITRAANVGGMLASGNTLRESQKYGQGLAAQEYNNWLNNLYRRQGLYAPLERGALGDVAGGRSSAYLTGGTGAANVYTGTGARLADVATGAGRDIGSAYLGTGARLADVATGTGANLANLFGTTGRAAAPIITSQAGALADLTSRAGYTEADIRRRLGQDISNYLSPLSRLEAGAYTDIADAMAGTYGMEAAGQTGASKNIWEALFAGGKLAAGLGYVPTGSYPQTKF